MSSVFQLSSFVKKKKKKTLGKLAAGACPRSRRHSTEKFDSRFLNNKKKIKLYFKNQVKIFLLLKKIDRRDCSGGVQGTDELQSEDLGSGH